VCVFVLCVCVVHLLSVDRRRCAAVAKIVTTEERVIRNREREREQCVCVCGACFWC